ncbi:amidase [Oricola thermophila]|uniref:Amidase n=1 Tax=Oricola thermophila TaxID=2742145 RepID=A0A6N1VBX2_9HYPH|nr:amidase [Oricola thermophila]QKV18380.1 amidase [Oricola thermophila]
MLSVTKLLEDIAAGHDSAEAAVARCRAEIAEHDGTLKAFAALAPGNAQVPVAGPLAGIAVGVKDIFDTYDMPTEYGSPIYAGFRPRADAPVVAMARARGAHVIGKTKTTEFAFLNPTDTVNPHDPAHTPGGSSSGSAAAVAAGMIPAAIGTQTGGSVVRPASFCGVAGYKPSFRLMPTGGMKTFAWTLDTTGLFAASARDVALFAARLTGRDLAVDEADAPRRIGLYRAAIDGEASDDMLGAVEKAANAAAKAGATVIEIAEPEELSRARDIHAIIQNYEAAISMGHELAFHADSLSPILRDTLEEGRGILPAEYDDARRIARRARKAATELFNDIDVLLAPSAPGAAPRDLGTTGSALFNKLWTLTGNPCVNVPGLADAAGMPLGVQVIGRFGRDKQTLSAAGWLENLLGN